MVTCRDAKSGRYGRYISLLFFLAGANFLAILGHFWAIMGHFGSFFGHFLVLFFFGQKSIFATFITFCISALVKLDPSWRTLQWKNTTVEL